MLDALRERMLERNYINNLLAAIERELGSVTVRASRLGSPSRDMSKVVGIDLGTTNSLVAYVTDGVPGRDPRRERRRAVAVGRVGRRGRHDLRRPRGAAAAADRRRRAPSTRSSASWARASTTSRDEARAVAVPRRRRSRRRRPDRARRPRVHAAGDLRVHPARAEAPRRGVLRRAGRVRLRSRSRGHHRAGLLQRRAAHGDARRRPPRRARGAADHQRADRGVARLRPRQAAHAASIAVYDLGGGTFDISILRVEDGVFQVLVDQRRHAPRRRRHRSRC